MVSTVLDRTWSSLGLRIVMGALIGLGVRAGVLWLAGPETLGGSTNLVLSAVAGGVLSVWMFDADRRGGPSMAWGLGVGLVAWLVKLVLDPVLGADPLDWSMDSIRGAFPTLVGYAVLGLVVSMGLAGVTNISVRRWRVQSAVRRALLGGVAGVVALVGYRLVVGPLAVAHLARAFNSSPGLPSVLGLTFAVGAVYALLFWNDASGHGFSIGWGLTLGFAVWLTVTLTLLPLASGDPLRWSLVQVQDTMAALLALLLFGVFTGASCLTLMRLSRALFAGGVVRARADEGLGARSVRAVLWGSVASVAGGIAFSIVMVWAGLLPAVAALVGASTPTTGFVVHMTISSIIGATYGLLFRRESGTLGAGIAWGLVYGFVWWLLGMLTLMPRLLGQPIVWSPENIQAAFASLVGHLAYGASTALVFQVLAIRYAGRPSALRRRTRPDDRFAVVAPLWASTLVLAIILPLLLAP